MAPSNGALFMLIKETEVQDIPTFQNWNELKDFFKEHESELKYLKNHEGETNLLGSGAYGKAFQIKGTDKVIKITTDEDELENAIKLKNKDFSSLAKIYYVQKVKPDLGIIITNLYNPLSANERSEIQRAVPYILEYFWDNWEDYKKHVKDEKIIDFAERVKKEYSSILDINEIDFHINNIL
jgi:phosphomevalonate kinase